MMQHNDLQSGHRNANSNSFLPLFCDDNIIKVRHRATLVAAGVNSKNEFLSRRYYSSIYLFEYLIENAAT